MNFDLPANVDLGDKSYPIPISKAMLMPLATSETIPNGLHITDEANGIDIDQIYGDSDVTVTIKDNKSGAEETFRYVDGVLEVSADTPVVEAEEAPGVEQFSVKDKFMRSALANTASIATHPERFTDWQLIDGGAWQETFDDYFFDAIESKDETAVSDLDHELANANGLEDYYNIIKKYAKKYQIKLSDIEKEVDAAFKESNAGRKEELKEYVRSVRKDTKRNSSNSTVKNVRGFSKKTVPNNIKSFSKRTSPSEIKSFSKKANKYSMKQFSKSSNKDIDKLYSEAAKLVSKYLKINFPSKPDSCNESDDRIICYSDKGKDSLSVMLSESRDSGAITVTYDKGKSRTMTRRPGCDVEGLLENFESDLKEVTVKQNSKQFSRPPAPKGAIDRLCSKFGKYKNSSKLGDDVWAYYYEIDDGFIIKWNGVNGKPNGQIFLMATPKSKYRPARTSFTWNEDKANDKDYIKSLEDEIEAKVKEFKSNKN